MAREYEIIDLQDIYSTAPELEMGRVEVYIDIHSKKEHEKIWRYLSKPKQKKKFRRILYVVLQGIYDDELYRRIEPGVAEMKFKGKYFNHSRIFCKELKRDGKKVVMVTLISKKANSIQDDSKLLTAIQKIQDYNYDI